MFATMMRKIGFVCLLAFLLTGALKAQQMPLYSQYMYNMFLINPALAGSDGYTTVNLTARNQWLGYYGAPKTYSVSLQTRILKRSHIIRSTPVRRRVYRPASDGRVGLGGYIFTDKNGLVQRTGTQFTYAYHIWFQETQLSFGLAGTLYQFKVNEDKLDFENPDDPILTGDLRRGVVVPDANFGVYLLNKEYQMGFSVEQLFQSFIKVGNQAYKDFRMLRHYYLYGAYSLPVSYDFSFEPSLLLKTSEVWKPQLDINAKFKYKEDLWAGIAYRTSGAIIVNVGARYENVHFGYAFDYTTSSIQKYSFGSHEFVMALKFGDNSRRYRWLDRY